MNEAVLGSLNALDLSIVVGSIVVTVALGLYVSRLRSGTSWARSSMAAMAVPWPRERQG